MPRFKLQIYFSGKANLSPELHTNATFKIIKPGKNADGYWKNSDLVQQLIDTMPIFESFHPECDLVFFFDNSQNHHAKCPDGLDANALNLNDGGSSVPLMHDVVRDGVLYRMQTNSGVQKGIRTILIEWDLWDRRRVLECANGCTSSDCCARRLLASQPEFINEKIWLQKTVEERGHRMIFFPKFHCELNFIEMIWGYLKSKLRRECSFSFSVLCNRVPEILSEEIPISFFRRAERHCLRFMSGYRNGFTGAVLDYVMKQYKGHRRIPLMLEREIQMNVDEIQKRISL